MNVNYQMYALNTTLLTTRYNYDGTIFTGLSTGEQRRGKVKRLTAFLTISNQMKTM